MVFTFFVAINSFAQTWPPVAPVNIPSGGFNIDETLMANATFGDWIDGTGTGGKCKQRTIFF
jgi:hypothetical protein